MLFVIPLRPFGPDSMAGPALQQLHLLPGLPNTADTPSRAGSSEPSQLLLVLAKHYWTTCIARVNQGVSSFGSFSFCKSTLRDF